MTYKTVKFLIRKFLFKGKSLNLEILTLENLGFMVVTIVNLQAKAVGMLLLFWYRSFELRLSTEENVTILPNMVKIKRFDEKIHGTIIIYILHCMIDVVYIIFEQSKMCCRL